MEEALTSSPLPSRLSVLMNFRGKRKRFNVVLELSLAEAFLLCSIKLNWLPSFQQRNECHQVRTKLK
jgi:hypothetical protein